MNKGFLKKVHPVLPVKHVSEAINYYVEKLGFVLSFSDTDSEKGYAGVCRDDIEIHLQWHDENEWVNGIDRPMLRIYVVHIAELYKEYETRSIFHKDTALRETPWGTMEFAFYDLYGNGLTFYRDK